MIKFELNIIKLKKVVIIKSKYLIIMLILISIVSISAVSAADDMNNTENGILETTDELSVGGGAFSR